MLNLISQRFSTRSGRGSGLYRSSTIELILTFPKITDLPDSDPYWEVYDALEKLGFRLDGCCKSTETVLHKYYEDPDQLQMYADDLRSMLKNTLLRDYVNFDRVCTYNSGLQQKDLVDQQHKAVI